MVKLTLSVSTIQSNDAGTSGGGIFNSEPTADLTITMTQPLSFNTECEW